MERLAPLPFVERLEDEPRIELLLADDDAALRTLLAARAADVVAALRVVEAEDGAEAIRIGLERRPQLALLDVNMPRLGGMEAAITLRELRPQTRVALHSGDPRPHRERAREHRLPLFDKLDLDRSIRWLELQMRALAEPSRLARTAPTRDLECSVCGYGVVRSAPPERCPMCQTEGQWVHTRGRRVDQPATQR
jgi:CheY-like chemotaxis protein